MCVYIMHKQVCQRGSYIGKRTFRAANQQLFGKQGSKMETAVQPRTSPTIHTDASTHKHNKRETERKRE